MANKNYIQKPMKDVGWREVLFIFRTMSRSKMLIEKKWAAQCRWLRKNEPLNFWEWAKWAGSIFQIEQMSRSMRSLSRLNFSQFLKLSGSIPAQSTSLSRIEPAQSGPQVQCNWLWSYNQSHNTTCQHWHVWCLVTSEKWMDTIPERGYT